MPVVGTEERRLVRELWDDCAISEEEGTAFRVVLEGGVTLHVDIESRIIVFGDNDDRKYADNLRKCFDRYLMNSQEYAVQQRQI